MAKILATYRVLGDERAATVRAREIAYEQTVELPAPLVQDPVVVGEVVGDVVSVEASPEDDRSQLVRLAFSSELACGQISQLLNLVFGNVSLWPGVRLVDLQLPDELLDQLPGPAFGVAGLRRAIGVGGRPLLATAIKPRGIPVADMARIAADFAAGGGDLVKDDQNLNDARHEDWYERVARCAEAVTEANAQHGRRCLYFPHVAGPPSEVERRLDEVVRLGLRGVLASPFLLGLDNTAQLVRRRGLVLMAHPALSGSTMIGQDHGMEPSILLGTLFRIAGADVSIFPHAGGRFRFTIEQCRELADALRRPLGALVPSLPAPAGGMDFDRLEGMAEVYGPDSVFLVGGALLAAGERLRENTTRFLDRIRSFHPERTPPDAPLASACEVPAPRTSTVRTLPLLRCNGDFEWEGRPSFRYKDDEELPFRGVRRVELVGQHGEPSAFDLRYFEVEPGGYTSLEKHVHVHAVIVARGEGVLLRGEERTPLRRMDVAYVAPLEVHQLRNESAEPFGFFCIVDSERDRPQAP